MGPEVDIDTQYLLANMQRFLSRKELQWTEWIQDAKEIQVNILELKNWSREFLKLLNLSSALDLADKIVTEKL